MWVTLVHVQLSTLFEKKIEYFGDSIQNPQIVHKSDFRHVNIVPYMLSKLLKKVENRLSSFSSVAPARQKIVLRKKFSFEIFWGTHFGRKSFVRDTFYKENMTKVQKRPLFSRFLKKLCTLNWVTLFEKNKLLGGLHWNKECTNVTHRH